MIKFLSIFLFFLIINAKAYEYLNYNYNYIPIQLNSNIIKKNIKVYEVVKGKQKLILTIKNNGLFDSSNKKVKTSSYPFLLEKKEINHYYDGEYLVDVKYYLIIEDYINGKGSYKNFIFEFNENNFIKNEYPEGTIWKKIEGNKAFAILYKEVLKDSNFKKNLAKVYNYIEEDEDEDLSYFVDTRDLQLVDLKNIIDSSCQFIEDRSCGFHCTGYKFKKNGNDNIKLTALGINTVKLLNYSQDQKYYVLTKNFVRTKYAGITISKDYCTDVSRGLSLKVEYLFGIDLLSKKITSISSVLLPWNLPKDPFEENDFKPYISNKGERYLIGTDKDIKLKKYKSLHRLINLNR